MGIKIAEKIKTKFHLSLIRVLKLFLTEKIELIRKKKKAILGAEGRVKIPNQNNFLDKYESLIYLYIYNKSYFLENRLLYASCRIRTCDPLLRRQLLYPAELRKHLFIISDS